MNIDTKVYRKHESPTFGNTLLGAVPLVSEVYLMDNIELMKHYPDKYFDLAVVDPPYGIGEDGGKCRTRKKHNNVVKHSKKNWDSSIPEMQYFTELFRVSQNQIIWGGNYFTQYLPSSMGWIYWDKKIGGDFSDGELAYTSFNKALKSFTKWNGNNGIARIHPCQKPVELYDFVFQYAKVEEGMKVLDTHLGSGSSRISANKNKLHFVGCEIDEEYFNKQNKRYEEFVSQARLW
jgi:site-specific DNA-methyltransferase (adenine-specific)